MNAQQQQQYHQRALNFIGLGGGAGGDQPYKDDNRAAFIRAACSMELPADADIGVRTAFTQVNVQLREIASQMDPDNRQRYETDACYGKRWNRDCLCGRLALLIARNPQDAAVRLTDEQRRLAATVFGLSVPYAAAPAGIPAEEQAEVCASRAEMSRLTKLANLALAGTATAAGYAAAAYVAPLPVLAGTIATVGVALASRWGKPALRAVYSAATDKRHVGAMRRALEPYAVDVLGNLTTHDLRDYFVRYSTMDANALSLHLATRFQEDASRNTINAILAAEIRERYNAARAAQRNTSINAIVGGVLSEFQFGGTALLQRMNSPNVTMFIPTAGLEHVGLRGAQDQPEYEAMRKLFATNYFVPMRPMNALTDLPQDIVEFWSAALATALDQRNIGAVPDDVLYTMYYFVWRYIDAYRLLGKLHCPNAVTRLKRVETGTGRSMSTARDVFDCVFEDYDRRYRESLTWTQAFFHHFGPAGERALALGQGAGEWAESFFTDIV